MVMHCGHFAAINRIPDDWSVEVVSPVSEKTELTMTAGHGSTALRHSEDVDGFATVLAFEEPQPRSQNPSMNAMVSTVGVGVAISYW
jgi:hypothetical protein